MEDSVKHEINEVLERHLPQNVGTVLKGRLEKADRDAKRVEELLAEIAEKKKEIDSLKSSISLHGDLSKREDSVSFREEDVTKRERESKILELEIRLEESNLRAEHASKIGLGLVRNTNYKSNIFDSMVQESYPDNNGNWVYPPNVTKNYSEEKTAD